MGGVSVGSGGRKLPSGETSNLYFVYFLSKELNDLLRNFFNQLNSAVYEKRYKRILLKIRAKRFYEKKKIFC